MEIKLSPRDVLHLAETNEAREQRDNERITELCTAHNEQYDMLSKGSWFCIGACVLGCSAVILWLVLLGGSHE